MSIPGHRCDLPDGWAFSQGTEIACTEIVLNDGHGVECGRRYYMEYTKATRKQGVQARWIERVIDYSW